MEKANNDLDILVNKVWKDENLSYSNLDFFSDEKLSYFCLKTIEAMLYLRS